MILLPIEPVFTMILWPLRPYLGVNRSPPS